MKIPIPQHYCSLLETVDKNKNQDMHGRGGSMMAGSESQYGGGQTTYQTGKTPMPAIADPSYYPQSMWANDNEMMDKEDHGYGA